MAQSRAAEYVSVMLDAGPIAHQGAGLGRYATELAAGLWQTQRERIDLHLFYNAHSGHELPASLREVRQHTLAMGQYPWRLSVLASQMLRHGGYERRLPVTDVYHATEHLLPRLARRTVLTVHDLIFRHLPETHTRKNRWFLNTGMPIFTRRADAIIAVSHQTKRDLLDAYGIAAGKVTVIPEGIDQNRFRPVAADTPLSQALQQRYGSYLLMVGTLEPRKNHAVALRALARLHAQGQGRKLVIVGGTGWKFSPVHQLVTRLGLETRVEFTGYVPEAELPAYYSNALALLQPSLYEGFGFPVLEAMACGTPVIASNRSSLPELTGPDALQTDPDNDEMLAHVIQDLAAQPALQARLCQAGLERVKPYTWAETCRQTTDLYQSLV